MSGSGAIDPRPDDVGTFAELREQLDRLRVTAARGRGKARLSVQDIAAASGVPRSTLANYLAGRTVIPADQLDAVVLALGVPPADAPAWADAWERAMSHHLAAAGSADSGHDADGDPVPDAAADGGTAARPDPESVGPAGSAWSADHAPPWPGRGRSGRGWRGRGWRGRGWRGRGWRGRGWCGDGGKADGGG